ncbi:Stk1 family PASTA domain-containing Ser/Thr kinase [uncultured Amnibacterium sp.]|uniref:Stk1 family PASTA domain-containing Ser/Thr kinase n=1 Tax=uncultured Amnibacterium sp. TaxID=1631851 RepID=UPI0035CBCF11
MDEQAPTVTAGANARLPANTPGDRTLAGRYRIDGLIGRGGMAEVHLGFDTRLSRTVAIKLLRSSLANDPTFRIRFRQEAQAASRMTHPTIVRVFDAGEETVLESGGGEAQLPFIVMEFVDGRLLKDMVADGPMSAPEAAHIVRGILTALEYSHRAGVVHRDIKPGNVMVTRTGQVKVMDFGIARAISDSSATVAQTTAILGTAQYFSPEQAKGESVDNRSDLYSTGIVLYEMLTGRAPFRGETPVAVAYQHVSERPETPSEVDPRISETMDAVVLRALEKDRADRYQDAAAFRDDVDAVLAGRKPVARLPRVDSATQLFGGAVPTADSAIRQLGLDDDTRVRTSGRPPVAWIWSGIAVVIVVVLAVAIWIVGLTTGGFGADSVTVPKGLVGSTESSAQTALQRLQLQGLVYQQASDSTPAGTVIRTRPAENAPITRGSAVDLWVSMGPQQVGVPSLDGRVESAALDAIHAAGLKAGAITSDHSATVPKDVVLRADPESGQQVSAGSTVDLVVSDGQVLLPSVISESVQDASDDLKAQGLSVDLTSKGGCGPASETVIQQSKPAGPVDQRSTITITYCDGT